MLRKLIQTRRLMTSELLRWLPEIYQLTLRRAAERAYSKATEGTPKQAKFAARCLTYSKSSDMCAELLDVSFM